MAKRKSDLGTLYRGSPGQWSWIAHRITGIAIILFLFVHIVDTAVVGWGPTAYDRVTVIYHNWAVRLLELGLVAAVLYHATNGVKIMIIDFWPRSVRRFRELTIATTVLFVLAMVPITWIMGKEILNLAFNLDL
ncbi:MAG: succinate dehydrogenase, cytochrome b556 subunit [Actinomycetota bacterium]